MKELRKAGFVDDEVKLFAGEDDAAKIDSSGQEHGMVATIARLIQLAGPERQFAERYEEAVRSGGAVVDVRTETEGRQNLADSILKEFGARFVNLYSPGSIARLAWCFPNSVTYGKLFS